MRIKDIQDEELRQLALERQSRFIGTSNDNEDIISAFNWAETTEGGGFWYDVNQGIITSLTEYRNIMKEKEEDEEIYIK